MALDAYRKIGRGGAGNFYSKHDLDKVTDKINEDVEAQLADVRSQALISDRSISDYAHAGRGGAGNWYSRSDRQKKGDFLSEVVAVGSIFRGRAAEYYGRGGAGNFKTGQQEQRMIEEGRTCKEEQRKQEEKIVQDVDANLERPEKAHLGAHTWDEDSAILV